MTSLIKSAATFSMALIPSPARANSQLDLILSLRLQFLYSSSKGIVKAGNYFEPVQSEYSVCCEHLSSRNLRGDNI